MEISKLEKVIKALESCSVQNDVGCQSCPYFADGQKYGRDFCTTMMAQDALVLIKDQPEIVRCKDCKHATMTEDKTLYKYCEIYSEKIIEGLEQAKIVIEKWIPMFEQCNTPAVIDEAINLLRTHEKQKIKQ